MSCRIFYVFTDMFIETSNSLTKLTHMKLVIAINTCIATAVNMTGRCMFMCKTLVEGARPPQYLETIIAEYKKRGDKWNIELAQKKNSQDDDGLYTSPTVIPSPSKLMTQTLYCCTM